MGFRGQAERSPRSPAGPVPDPVAFACSVLNRMTRLGMPVSQRIA
jgi:hypothetical protein